MAIDDFEYFKKLSNSEKLEYLERTKASGGLPGKRINWGGLIKSWANAKAPPRFVQKPRANIKPRPELSPHEYPLPGKRWTILDLQPQRDLCRLAQRRPLILRHFPGLDREATNELQKRFDRWLKKRVRRALAGFGGLESGKEPKGWFKPQHMPEWEELHQEARIALLGRIQKYNPKSPNGLNAYARKAIDGAIHDEIKRWRLKGRTLGTAGDERESRADRWLYDHPWIRERGVGWRRTTADDIIKAIGCTPKSARTAIGSRAGYSSGDDSYSTTEFHIADDESHPFAGDDGPLGQAEDISSEPDFTPERVVEPDDGVSPLFAADEWRRNHDCFSKYWLSPHRIFHEVIFTGRTRSSVLDARVIEIDLRNMRRLAEIGREVFFGGKLLRARRHAKISRQQYADELVAYDHARKDYAGIVPLFDPAPVWLRRPADRYLPEYFTVPRVYSLTINTAATAQPETEFYGWQYDHPSAAWPLVWSEKDRRGRWRVVDTRPITDNASRRMADLVIAIDNLGDTNAKPERHDVVRVGGDLHSDHGIDRGDIRPID